MSFYERFARRLSVASICDPAAFPPSPYTLLAHCCQVLQAADTGKKQKNK